MASPPKLIAAEPEQSSPSSSSSGRENGPQRRHRLLISRPYNLHHPHQVGQIGWARREMNAAERNGAQRLLFIPAHVGGGNVKKREPASTVIDNGGSSDVAAEVEVDIDRVDSSPGADGASESIEANNNQQVIVVAEHSDRHPAFQQHGPPPPPPTSNIGANGGRGGARRPAQRAKTAGHYTAQQLVKFDPMQCFDIDELRNRMFSAQQRIEDSASMHLNYNRLKNENMQMRDELSVCDHRIFNLESAVMEKNAKLRELLKENVFLRAQFKKIQSEFGVDAVREIFNRTERGPQHPTTK